MFHHSKEFRVEFGDVFPVHLTHDESMSISFGFVNDLRPTIKTAFKATKNIGTLKTYFEPYLTINLVTYVDLTLHSEDYLIYRLKLFEYNLSRKVSDRLQMLQDVLHKVLKLRVVKSPETFLLPRKSIFKGKELTMPKKKATIQKVCEYSILYVCRQLF